MTTAPRPVPDDIDERSRLRMMGTCSHVVQGTQEQAAEQMASLMRPDLDKAS